LLVGPQFRRSADVVAIVHHQLPQRVVHDAVDGLVQREPRGRWLQSPIPAARARADRAERVFVFTSPNVLVIAPPRLEKQIFAAPPTGFPAPEGDQALVVHVKTPWRALIGLPFELPRSLAWLRLDVTPLDSGGALVRLEARDETAAAARDHAAALSLALNAVTNPDLGPLGALLGLQSIAFIDPLRLQARGERISGEVTIRPRQMDRLMAYAEQLVAEWTGSRSVESARSGSARPRADEDRVPAPPVSAGASEAGTAGSAAAEPSGASPGDELARPSSSGPP
jgi:hypothetical protein